MSAGASSEKLCAVCGTDVAGKPRVKNAQGEYLCKGGDCEKTALERAKAPRQARTAPLLSDPDQALMSNLISASPMLNATTCPQCATPVTGGAVVCIRCGCNLQTGKRLKTTVVRESPDRTSGSAPRGSRSEPWDWGPSYGVCAAIGCALAFSTYMALLAGPLVGLIASGLVSILGISNFIYSIVVAFQSGRKGWGICGICMIVPIANIIALIPYICYMLAWCPSRVVRGYSIGSIFGALLGIGVLFAMGQQALVFPTLYAP